VVIFVLLLGGHLYGIVGALVALPLAAIARETTTYLSRHLVMEPWGTPSAAAIHDGRHAAEVRPARRRCPECGTAALPGAEFCFACGTPLRPRLRSHRNDAPEPASRRRRLLPSALPVRRPGWLGRRRTRTPRTATPEPAPVAASSPPDGADTPP